MKTLFFQISLLASATAEVFPGFKYQIVKAEDPPAMGGLFSGSSDGALPSSSEGTVTVINYTPSVPNSCFTLASSLPPASDPIKGGTCAVCVVQRQNGDGSGDYLFWARDSANNAMGNLIPTNVWPIDGMSAPNDITNASMPMSDGLTLLLQTSLSVESPHTATQMNFLWVMPPHNPTVPGIWTDTSDPQMPQAQFDPGANPPAGTNCTPAGSVSNSQVTYVQCSFPC